MTEKTEIWDKQKYEPGKAYALFCIYRDLGPFRSIDKTTQTLQESDNKTYTPSYLRDLSAKWHWVKRAEAYDEHMEKVIRRKREDAIIEMTDRHAEQSKDIQEEIYKSFKDPALKNEDIQKAGWVRNANVNSYVKSAKLERLSRGLPSDKVENDVKEDVKVNGDINFDERREKLKEKMRKVEAENDIVSDPAD